MLASMFFTGDSQSNLFKTNNNKDSLQDIQTKTITVDKSSINHHETSGHIPESSNTQQGLSHSSPVHVESQDVEEMGHSTNVSTQHLQSPMSEKARNLTSESQMLLSGVQTIPEQLPLILTEGDAEDHESLTIIAGNEQLQVYFRLQNYFNHLHVTM